MEGTIYIRLRNRVHVKPNHRITLGQIAQVIAPEELLKQIRDILIHQVTLDDKNIIIIDLMKVMQNIHEEFPKLEIQTIGPSQTIVEVVFKKKKISIPLFVGVWLLLFFGAALAIMNFHEDVSMRVVHQKIYTLITGETNSHPLIFQVPYSIGLGLGMILFFNHFFRKRLNEEPSPLEVEIFNYQQDLDQYVIMHENKENMRHLDDI